MKPIYKVFYREKGIRYSDRLLRLPSFNLTVLPRSSLFHYVSDDINSPEVDTSLPFFQGYSKKILLDYITDYVKTVTASSVASSRKSRHIPALSSVSPGIRAAARFNCPSPPSLVE